MMPEGVKQNKARTILQHLSEAWRCWKVSIRPSSFQLPLYFLGATTRFIHHTILFWDAKDVQVEGAIEAQFPLMCPKFRAYALWYSKPRFIVQKFLLKVSLHERATCIHIRAKRMEKTGQNKWGRWGTALLLLFGNGKPLVDSIPKFC